MAKTVKASPEAESGIVAASNTTRVNGNKDNYLLVNNKGLTLAGPMSIVAGSSQIRFSALWVMNNEIAMSLPSTMATPTPTMKISPPVEQFASLVAEASIMIENLA